MLRKIGLILSIVLVMAMVSLSACSSSTPAPSTSAAPATSSAAPGTSATSPVAAVKATELRFANYFGPAAAQAVAGQAFCDEIGKATNGKVKINYYPGGSLVTAPDMFDGISKGIADIGFGGMAYHSGKFPQTEILELPVGVTSGWAMSHVANELIQKYTINEWSAVKVLWFSGPGPSIIMSTKAVNKVEDLKGLKIRAQGRPGQVVTALGGTPMGTPMAEAYEAVTKGVLDGFLLSCETLKSFKLGEVLKYVTVVPEIGQAFNFYAVMNPKTFNGLPADVQQAFTQVAKAQEEKYAIMWNNIDIEGAQFGKDKGMQFIQISKDEAAKWSTTLKPVVDGYVNDMVKAGSTAAEQQARIQYFKDRMAYWTQQQTAQKIPFPF